MILQILDRTGYRNHLAEDSRDNGEDRLANLDELISAAREFDQEHPGASIHDFLADVTLASPIDRWDQQTGAATLMTLHAAKGLEFPVVFIVALEEGLLPHTRAHDDDKRAGGGAQAAVRRHHPGPARALPQPVPDPDIPRPAAGDVSVAVPGGAAARADGVPRSLGNRASGTSGRSRLGFVARGGRTLPREPREARASFA